MNSPAKRPTLHDVAKSAGVAVSTVSSILNNRPDSWSSQETRDRVFAAARQLQYKPNRMARALRLSRFQAATLVVPDLTNPLYALLARSIQRALEKSGYELLIEDTEESVEREKKILADVASHNTDGIIMVLSVDASVHASRIEELSRAFPIIIIGEEKVPSRVDTMHSDWRASLCQAIEHLIGMGHRSIGLVDSLEGREDVLLRVQIASEQMRLAGLPVDDRNVVHCRHNPEAVRLAVSRWAETTAPRDRATAFICTNDLTAIGSMRGLLDAGLRVPEDISLVGFDDIPLASYLPRPLTTIAQPVTQLGTAAAQTLLDRIAGRLQGPSTHQVFPTSLIIRESTAPPPRGS
jgi:DNA-binding LacI/PurR family transcriptional regulator